jgi:hypothetical protein
MTAELSDKPLVRPEDDLLGVAPSAKTLASRLVAVKPPFYGGRLWRMGLRENHVRTVRRRVPSEVGAALVKWG